MSGTCGKYGRHEAGKGTELSNETTYSFPSISTFRQNIYRSGVESGKVYVRSAGNDFYDNGPCGGASDRESQNLSCTGVEIDDTKNFEEVITVAALNADGVKSSYSTPGATIWVSGFGGEYGITVSYTHLTLPTNREV